MQRVVFFLLLFGLNGCAVMGRRGIEGAHIETSSFSFDATTYAGEAEVYLVAMVDREGRLGDWFVAGSTDARAEPIAEGALKTLKFHAGRLNGVSQSGPMGLILSLADGQGVAASTVADALSVSVTPRPTDGIVRVYQRERLDATPVLLKHVAPVPTEGRGVVTLQFWVDESGTVRLPSVVAGFDDGLARAALDAVIQWEFSPPLKNGRPVKALFRQQFEFQ